MIDTLLNSEWRETLDRIRATGSVNERLMASMLDDVLSGARPKDVFDAWASTFLDRAA